MHILHQIQITGHTIILDDNPVFTHEGPEQDFLNNAYKHAGIAYPKFYKMDELSKAGFLAADYLLKDSSFENISPYKKGIVLQNISSSLATDRKYQATIEDIASPALFVYTLPNIVMGEIAIRNIFKGENTFFVVDAYNQQELDNYVNILFKQDVLEICLAGFIEQNDVRMQLLAKN